MQHWRDPKAWSFIEKCASHRQTKIWGKAHLQLQADEISLKYVYNYLELQTTSFLSLFQVDDSKSLHKKLLFHQPSIKKLLFRVLDPPSSSVFIFPNLDPPNAPPLPCDLHPFVPSSCQKCRPAKNVRLSKLQWRCVGKVPQPKKCQHAAIQFRFMVFSFSHHQAHPIQKFWKLKRGNVWNKLKLQYLSIPKLYLNYLQHPTFQPNRHSESSER